MQVVDREAREPLRASSHAVAVRSLGPRSISKSASMRLTASSATEPIGAPERARHIGDRAGDICELLCLAQDLDRNILVWS